METRIDLQTLPLPLPDLYLYLDVWDFLGDVLDKTTDLGWNLQGDFWACIRMLTPTPSPDVPLDLVVREGTRGLVR
ncbi:unnamed protein product [Periconia digitata]|uniref:Uncharacterized protein n=1 Tax=Periconia digitata TaxID=1303443 RepID=A0A9W4XWY5_9PLEO|nr:unnamed protein product [Periconia digitata]